MQVARGRYARARRAILRPRLRGGGASGGREAGPAAHTRPGGVEAGARRGERAQLATTTSPDSPPARRLPPPIPAAPLTDLLPGARHSPGFGGAAADQMDQPDRCPASVSSASPRAAHPAARSSVIDPRPTPTHCEIYVCCGPRVKILRHPQMGSPAAAARRRGQATLNDRRPLGRAARGEVIPERAFKLICLTFGGAACCDGEKWRSFAPPPPPTPPPRTVCAKCYADPRARAPAAAPES